VTNYCIGFEAFKAVEVQELTDLKNVVSKKSNIKDVCALLDMKSSKYQLALTVIDIDDVNKAFEEMHLEVEQKINKGDYEQAMVD